MFGKVGSGITAFDELDVSNVRICHILARPTPVPLSTTSGLDSMLRGSAVAVLVFWQYIQMGRGARIQSLPGCITMRMTALLVVGVNDLYYCMVWMVYTASG